MMSQKKKEDLEYSFGKSILLLQYILKPNTTHSIKDHRIPENIERIEKIGTQKRVWTNLVILDP